MFYYMRKLLLYITHGTDFPLLGLKLVKVVTTNSIIVYCVLEYLLLEAKTIPGKSRYSSFVGADLFQKDKNKKM